MKSLAAGSSLNLFLVKYNLNYRPNICFTRPTNVCLTRPLKSHFLDFSPQHEASFSQTHLRFSLCVLSSSELQTKLEEEEEDNAGDNPIPVAEESESVRVKFELQRECLFGQHFFLVGDDPTFGSWDPSMAIPLSWSDGHKWYVELDICVGKSIKYKFILNQGDGTILWQPGEDRVLQTYQTSKTIKVTDNWDNLEAEVVEKESKTELFEQIVANSDMQLVAENLTIVSKYDKDDTGKDPRDDAETFSMPVEILSSENLKENLATNNDKKKGQVEIVTERIQNHVIKNKLTHSFSSPEIEIDQNMLSKGKNNENLDYIEELPVLVPGLIPLPTSASEETEADEIEENTLAADIYRELDIIGEDNVPDLCGSSRAVQNIEEEAPNESRESPDTSTLMTYGNTIQHVENTHAAKDDQVSVPPPDNDKLECNLQWGRKILNKILMSLGL